MSSTLQVGRVGVDFTLNRVVQVDHDAGELTVRGWITSSSTGSAVLRQQLLGYVDDAGWEPVVPVIFSWSSEYTGFYQVLDASVDQEPTYAARNIFGFGIQLRRVSNYGQPTVEELITGVARTTAHVVTPTYWHSVPSAIYLGGYGPPAIYTATRVGPGGTHYFHRNAAYASTTMKYAVSPADWYSGSCYIKSAGYYVTGSQAKFTLSNSNTAWEVGNGLVRITSSATSGTVRLISPIYATPASWGTAHLVKLGHYNSFYAQTLTVDTPLSAKVIYNTPAECVLRVTYPIWTGTGSFLYTTVAVDFRVQRGSRYVEVTMTSPSAQNWGFESNSADAGTAITGGAYKSSNDADGNRWVYLSADAFSTSLGGPTRLYLTADGTTFRGALGHEVGGSSAADPDRDTDLRDQYFAAISSTPRVVAG